MEIDVENEKKITHLISTLQLAKSTDCLIIARCNELALREVIYEKISAALQDKISIYRLKIDATNKDLPGILSNIEIAPHTVFFVYGIEEAMPDVISYLNFKREVFYEIKKPVVIWVDDFVLSEIATKALDFWAFRSRVFEFSMPKMEVVMPKSIKELLGRQDEIYKEIRKDYKQKTTIMFTDIVGSTRYFAEKGEYAFFSATKRYNDLASSTIKRYNGKIIGAVGDGIIICFDKADNAIFSAIKIQETLAKYNKEAGEGIHIRIGIHSGFAITEPNDIYGDAVNTTARIEALACGDQILISEAVKNELSIKGHNLYFYGNYRLKGITKEIPIYEVLWYKEQRPKKPEKYKEPIPFSLHNQTPPEPNFVGRVEMLETITNWYKSSDVQIGVLVGWGGFGKSALARRWYDSLEENNIQPDGIFWWGFYRNPYLERLLEELLRYLAQGRLDLGEIKTSWQKVERIKEFITEREYLIVLDGLEVMQKEEWEEFGAMRDRDFQEILKYIADSDFKGLCLITTRFPMKNIEAYSSYQKLEVEELSKEDTRLLFKKVGVRGMEEEIDEVWCEFGGHTLSLVLLANYLGKDGDIKKVKEIPPLYSDEEAGGKAHRMLLWYDGQLDENQRQFMKIFSLFRQAVGEREFKEIFLPRIKMEPFHFKRMVDNLCQRRLISKHSDSRLQTPDSRLPDSSYTTHPLIKGYFESIFDEEEKKACHKAIYKYFGKAAPDFPTTLEEMQPLFEQVYHGTSAGLYDEVFEDVYQKKISRKDEFFITYKLGAWETDLSLVKTFFPKGNFSQMPLVSKRSDQSWLLNEAGVTLLNIGKPKEAEEPLKAAIDLYIETKDWKHASLSYEDIADLLFRMGKIIEAKESAKISFRMAEQAKDKKHIARTTAYLAYTIFLLGKTEDAEKLFDEADKLQREIDPNTDGLYGIWGVFYSDFLTNTGKTDNAFNISKRNLVYCTKINWLASISRCHRSLGCLKRIKGNLKESSNHLNNALEIAKRIGMPELEIEALLESGRLDLDMEKYEDAIRKADDALKLITRTGFRLYEPEAELILAKAYLSQGNKEKAKSFATSAYEKSTKMHYHWPKLEANEMSKAIQKRNP